MQLAARRGGRAEPLVQRRKLDNGLTVLVDPRGSAPGGARAPSSGVAACWLRLGVGAAYERPPERGAAHFVEHMLFKGSRSPQGAPGLGSGEVGLVMDRLGADLNAYTTYEETVVHCVLPARHVAEALDLLGDMAFRSVFDELELQRERSVVLEEIAQGRDQAARMLAEALAARIWGRHPYGAPILGTRATVRGLSRAALYDFYRQWYAPDNACLTVAGDVDPAAIFGLAQRMSAGCSGKRRLPGPRPQPPRRRGLGLVRVTGSFEEQIVELAMPLPGQDHPHMPAIDVLISALGEGASAVLPTRLHVQQAVAHAAWAGAEVGVDGGLLATGFTPAGQGVGEGLQALGACLREVRRHGVPLDSFRRARTAILSDAIYNSETAEGRAAVLSWYQGYYGDYEEELRYRAKVAALTPRQVNEAARRYLRPERAVVGLLGPGIELGRAEVSKLLAPRRPARRAQALRHRPRSPGAGEVTRCRLSNGLRILVEPDPEAPLVAMRAVGLGGGLLARLGTAGHGQAWADLVTEGAGDLDAITYAEAVEALSGSVRGSSSLSTCGLEAVFPADKFPAGLHLALMPLLRPRFDPEAVDRVVESMADSVRTQEDDAPSLAWDAMLRLAFPRHPYRLPGGGNERSLQRITPRVVQRFHARVLRASNMVIALAGALDPQSVIHSIERLLCGMSRGGLELGGHAPPAGRRKKLQLQGPWSQGRLLVGFRSCSVSQEDRPALDVLAAIMGSPGGRLFQRLREETGLCYDTSAVNVSALQGGVFTCALSTAPQRIDDARKELARIMSTLRLRPPGGEEIGRAQATLAGAVAADLQRASVRAWRMAQDELFGLDGRRYRANLADTEQVTERDLHRVLRRYLAAERQLVVEALPRG